MPPPKRPPEGARWKIPDWNPYASDEEERVKTYLDQVEELRRELATARERIDQLETENRSLQDDIARNTATQESIDAAAVQMEQIDDWRTALASWKSHAENMEAEVTRQKSIVATRDSKISALTHPDETLGSQLFLIITWPIVMLLKYRGAGAALAIVVLPVTLFYFVIVSHSINQKDPKAACFEDGGNFMHCGFVRGVWRPAIAGGAWVLGVNDAPETEGATSNTVEIASTKSAVDTQIAEVQEVTPTPTPSPEPVYIPPPRPVIDPNVIVRDLAEQSKQIATELGWTEEQANCARREAIDGMRELFVEGIGRGDAEQIYDRAKYRFQTVANCNRNAEAVFMDRMIYDDENYFRKLQQRIASGEFGEVWPPS